MDREHLLNLFDLSGRVAVITGGAGVICGAMARALGQLGVKVIVLDISLEAAERVAAEIRAAGGEGLALRCDVLDKASLEQAAAAVDQAYGRVDILVNGAGGNRPQATTNADLRFFDIPQDVLHWVFDLNLFSAILASQVFGRRMAAQDEGVILNISSMSASRPLTRIVGYSAAKAGVDNFTQWLAVYMAQEVSANIRVNAIAPGFLVGEQNRSLLYDADGQLSARGKQIIAHTPMARFGETDDLLGTFLWLISPAARFVTGVIVPIDGGFSAFSGV